MSQESRKAGAGDKPLPLPAPSTFALPCLEQAEPRSREEILRMFYSIAERLAQLKLELTTQAS